MKRWLRSSRDDQRKRRDSSHVSTTRIERNTDSFGSTSLEGGLCIQSAWSAASSGQQQHVQRSSLDVHVEAPTEIDADKRVPSPSLLETKYQPQHC